MMIYDDPFHRVPRGFDSCNAICAVLHAHDSELHLRVQGRTPVGTISLPAPDCQVWHEHKWLQRFQTKYENIWEKQDGTISKALTQWVYKILETHWTPSILRNDLKTQQTVCELGPWLPLPYSPSKSIQILPDIFSEAHPTNEAILVIAAEPNFITFFHALKVHLHAAQWLVACRERSGA